MSKAKILYRSSTNKQLAGVCAGLAEYFDVDPTLMRVGFVLASLFSGVIPGIIAYAVLALIIPKKGTKNG